MSDHHADDAEVWIETHPWLFALGLVIFGVILALGLNSFADHFYDMNIIR